MPKRRSDNAPYWEGLRDTERQMIRDAIGLHKTLTQAAKHLGISTNYLSERSRELGVTDRSRAVINGRGTSKVSTEPEAVLMGMVNSLVEALRLAMHDPKAPEVADYRVILDLLDRGMVTAREAAHFVQRAQTHRASKRHAKTTTAMAKAVIPKAVNDETRCYFRDASGHRCKAQSLGQVDLFDLGSRFHHFCARHTDVMPNTPKVRP